MKSTAHVPSLTVPSLDLDGEVPCSSRRHVLSKTPVSLQKPPNSNSSVTYHTTFVISFYSHSMVAGGLELMSYVTRLIPRTSLMILFEIRPRIS